MLWDSKIKYFKIVPLKGGHPSFYQIRFEMLWDSKIKYFKIVPLKGGHPSNKTTFAEGTAFKGTTNTKCGGRVVIVW